MFALLVAAGLATAPAAHGADGPRLFGPPNADVARLVPLPDGGALLVGRWTARYNGGDWTPWAARVDDRGRVRWSRTYAGHGVSWATSGALLPDGAFVLGVTAMRELPLPWTDDRSFDTDAGALVVEANGDVRAWHVDVDPTANGRADGVAATADGFALATTAGFPQGHPSSRVARYDATGRVSWVREYPAPDRGAIGGDLVALPGGDLFLSGLSGVYDDGSGGRTRILRLAPSGDVRWDRTFPGPGAWDDEPRLLLLGDGVVAAGTTDYGTTEGSSAWVVRVAGDGEAVWARDYGAPTQPNPSYDAYEPTVGDRWYGGAVAATPTGFVLVGAHYDTVSSGWMSAWVLRLSADGAVRQETRFWETSDTGVAGAVVHADGSVLLGGTVRPGRPYRTRAWIEVVPPGQAPVGRKAPTYAEIG